MLKSYYKHALSLLTLIVFILLALASNQNSTTEKDPSNSAEYKALKLAVESNINLKSFRRSCIINEGWVSDDIAEFKSIIALVPLTREIVETAIAYKVKVEKLDQAATYALWNRSRIRFLESDTTAFVLYVINDKFNNEDIQVKFANFSENIQVKDEHGTSYNVIKYNRIFDDILKEGWNQGYVYFPNFQQSNMNSYSVHISGFHIKGCNEDPKENENLIAALSYDVTNIGFLELLRKGVPEDTLRAAHVPQKAKFLSLSVSDMVAILAAIVTILK